MATSEATAPPWYIEKKVCFSEVRVFCEFLALGVLRISLCYKHQQDDEALSVYSALSAARMLFFTVADSCSTLNKILLSSLSLLTQPANHNGRGVGQIANQKDQVSDLTCPNAEEQQQWRKIMFTYSRLSNICFLTQTNLSWTHID